MEDIGEKLWRYVVNYGQDSGKIRALSWDVYAREKYEFINRKFSVSVTHPKGGNIGWTCVKDNITERKEDYKAIGIRGFDYKLF